MWNMKAWTEPWYEPPQFMMGSCHSIDHFTMFDIEIQEDGSVSFSQREVVAKQRIGFLP